MLGLVARSAERGGVLIDLVIYAEFFIWYDAIENCERTIAVFGATLKSCRESAVPHRQRVSPLPRGIFLIFGPRPCASEQFEQTFNAAAR